MIKHTDNRQNLQKIAELRNCNVEQARAFCERVQELCEPKPSFAVIAQALGKSAQSTSCSEQDIARAAQELASTQRAKSASKRPGFNREPVRPQILPVPESTNRTMAVPAQSASRAGSLPSLAGRAAISQPISDVATADPGPDPTNPESSYAYELMKGSTPCIFVTGKAGTGKSYLLRYFVEKTAKRVVLLAPTGVAALNIGGQTIHSFFGFPPQLINEDEITLAPAARRQLYRQVDTIVIDEVSMVNANLMDAIDTFMRINGRDETKPFGGAQVILFGDLFQLPPVVSDKASQEFFAFHYASPFFFDAKVFRDLPIRTVELQKNYRQKDARFIELLNAIRVNQLSDQHREWLNAQYDPAFQPPDSQFFMTLTTTNYRADEINARKLAELRATMYSFEADIEGTFEKNAFPTDVILSLKQGAQVIFVKNDNSNRWVNGTLGRVTGLDKDWVEVEVVSDNHPYIYRIERETWTKLKYKFNPYTGRITTEIVGKFTQYPLRLAWAITIHKSQGQTYDRAMIDLTGGAFEAGQVYVALSRCRSLEGIVLKTEIWRNDVLKANSRVVEFARQMEQERLALA